ncbi:MAG TPA: alpha/beta hydrolase [Microcoleaceae cyanobacterium]|jgi:dienelactone hydrolase
MRRQVGLLLGLFLLLLGLGLWTPYMGGRHRFLIAESAIVTIPVNGEEHLVARLYTPESHSIPYPVMVLGHGASSSKEFMLPIAWELARQGIAALAIDFGGLGESYDRPYSDDLNVTDLRAAIAWLRQQPERFDPQRIGGMGHSMGADAVLTEATNDSQLQPTVVLGMRGISTPKIPQNLLLGIGLYEQFHPATAMREMLQQATGKSLVESQFSGDFQQGTARLLAISPTTDHVGEPFDPDLIQQTVNWVKQAFGIPGIPVPIRYPTCLPALALTLMGTIVTTVWLCVALEQRLQTDWLRRIFAIEIVMAAIVIWGLSTTGMIPVFLVSHLWILGFVVLLVGNYTLWVCQQPAIDNPRLTLAQTLRSFGLYVGLALAALVGVSLVVHIGELLTHPAYWLGLPQACLHMPLSMLFSTYFGLRAELFVTYSVAVQPNYWLWGLLVLPEIILPGIVLSRCQKISQWAIHWLRQPLTIDWQQVGSQRSLLLVPVLLLVLAGMLWQRSQMGLLSGQSLIVSIQVVGQLFLLPLLGFTLVVRSQAFQRLEQWWLKVFL